MSFNFWLKLIAALCLFGAAIGFMQLYKSELVRGIRARRLRRRIIPLTQAINSLLVAQARTEETEQQRLGNGYELMRARADLEALYQRSKPLFEQERLGILRYLESLTSFSRSANSRQELEETVLLGQRVVHELTELGL